MSEEILRIMCPALTCRRVLTVPVSSRGKKVRCRNCGMTIKIPEKQSKPEPTESPSAPMPKPA